MVDLEGGNVSFKIDNPEARRLEDAIRMGGLRISLALFAATITLGSMAMLAVWSVAPLTNLLAGFLGVIFGGFGAVLFGFLGIHVFFARFISLRFWRGVIGRVLRFFSLRRRRERREQRRRERERERRRS